MRILSGGLVRARDDSCNNAFLLGPKRPTRLLRRCQLDGDAYGPGDRPLLTVIVRPDYIFGKQCLRSTFA